MEIKSNGEIAWLEFPAGCFILHMDVEEVTDDFGGHIILSKRGSDACLVIFPETDQAPKCYEAGMLGPYTGKVYYVGQESKAIDDFRAMTGYNMFDEVQPGMMIPHNCISTTPGV